MKIRGNEQQESISGRPSCNACVLLEVLAGERTEESRHDACRETRSTRASHKPPPFCGPGLVCSAGTARNAHSGVMGHLAGHEVIRNARSPGKLGSLQGGTSQKCSLSRRNRALGLRKHGKARQGRPERARNALLPEIRGQLPVKHCKTRRFRPKRPPQGHKSAGFRVLPIL